MVINGKNKMKMIKVNSSNVHSIGYDESTLILAIVFKNGSYKYSNVPKEIYNGLISASSKGTYIHRFIVGKFSFQKIS